MRRGQRQISEKMLKLQPETIKKTDMPSADRPLILGARMKAAELLGADFYLLGVFSRLGIRLGFGEATVGELCEGNGIDTSTFLTLCRIHLVRDYIPSEEEIAKLDMGVCLKYLKQSHSYYRTIGLTALGKAMTELLAPCGEKQKKVIRRFYDEYHAELEKHFAFEEEHIFPYAEAIASGKEPLGNFEKEFEEDHSNIGEKIGDLKNIVMKYLPAECGDQEIQQVLLLLCFLENDLERHTAIEERVLVPRISRGDTGNGE